MNFLAHLYLAEPSAASRIGNLLPDFARYRPSANDHPEFVAGITNHRRVDAFTDTHPLFARSRSRILPHCGRFSGIVVDVLYDHVLARHWSRHHTTPLPAFIDEVHEQFRSHRHLMPPEMQPIIDRMDAQRWLRCYETRTGLRICFQRMSMRFSERFGREVALASAVDVLDEHGDGLAEDFNEFFPQLVAYVHNQPAVACAGRSC